MLSRLAVQHQCGCLAAMDESDSIEVLCTLLISEARDVMPSRQVRYFGRFLTEQNPAQRVLAIRQDRLGRAPKNKKPASKNRLNGAK